MPWLVSGGSVRLRDKELKKWMVFNHADGLIKVSCPSPPPQQHTHITFYSDRIYVGFIKVHQFSSNYAETVMQNLHHYLQLRRIKKKKLFFNLLHVVRLRLQCLLDNIVYCYSFYCYFLWLNSILNNCYM